MKRFKDIFRQFSPDAQKKLSITIFVISVTVVLVITYVSTRSDKPEKSVSASSQTILFDRDKTEKSLYEQTAAMIKKQEAVINGMLDKLHALDQKIDEKLNQPLSAPENLQDNDKSNKLQEGIKSFPEPTDTGKGIQTSDQALNRVSGGIHVMSAPVSDIKPDPAPKDDNIYLPPSFMKATLLTGVAAPTVSGGTSHPVPMMFRVQTPAVLPNHIRKNLKGCFVIAEGKGDLASERIKTRLLTLSCISKNGERVIDQKISGFAVDADGQVDISGRVVSRMGRSLARVALAGFLGGVGEAVSSAQGTLNYTDSGVVKDFGDDTQTYVKAGLGKGLQTSLEKLQDFYLQLANQTLPVIETGPSKQVHLVVSEGSKLNVFFTSPNDFQTGES